MPEAVNPFYIWAFIGLTTFVVRLVRWDQNWRDQR